MLLDRFPGGGPDSNLKRNVSLILLVPGQIALDMSCTSYRCGRRYKRSHNTVAGVLYLAAAQISQRVSDNRVVHVKQRQGRLIAQCLSQCRRFDNVGKEDGADPRIPLV